MEPQRAYITRNVDENVERETPLEVLVDQVTNKYFMDVFQVFFQEMMTQANREVVVPVNAIVDMTRYIVVFRDTSSNFKFQHC